MKRKVSIGLLSVLLATNILAQKTGIIEDGFDVKDFPEVSFIYHSYNPDVLNKSNFWHLKEAGNNRDFKVEKLSHATNSLPQTIIILWEDMGHNGYEQFDFTKKVLSGFFNSAKIPSSDSFAVYAFNRRKNTSSALIKLTDGFTKDKTVLLSAIQGYKHNTETYSEFPNRSDMYTSIREGLELLAPVKGSKAIIVFTSGYSMKNSGSDSESQVLLKAQQLHIPVYIFQYYYKSGVAPESEGFAKSTFGSFSSYKDVATAERAIIELYPQISKRYQGNDYKVSFQSDAKRGTGARMIALSVDGEEIQEQLLPPPHTFGTWVSSHLWLVVIIVVLIIALAVSAVMLIRKAQKTANENRLELADLEQRRKQDKEAAEQYQRELEIKAKKEAEAKAKEEEVARLLNLMKVKNIYPRLKYSLNSSPNIYEINNPITRIGRDQDNDLVLNDNKVSRHHAEIVFNGSGFVIIDKGSTNKVVVNGQFVESLSLKNGDMIGLGEIILTFYL